ncbi:MAG: hypothetical protein KAI72_04135 [Candidatus Pacebacteria bacterium]|nr:hypothetical protein [Candidatus Paceibacterota bacterium]
MCSFIKQGLLTKEIAKMLSLSIRTIDFHRENIRKKFDINNRKTSITSYLRK